MLRCETCGRQLTYDKANRDINDGGKPFHFCSRECESTWKETIRNVSVAH
ncbi:MAG: hypothetical protein WED04_07920 [Promethearchaeati archaeon SRVP18_Atabeyarchaeia-1]